MSLLRRTPKPVPTIPANPLDIQVNQFFSVDGVRFKCASKPRVSAQGAQYVVVGVRKYGLTRLQITIEPAKEKVLVAPLSSSTVR
jgi:hypothetical protein